MYACRRSSRHTMGGVCLVPLADASDEDVSVLTELIAGSRRGYLHRQEWSREDILTFVRYANEGSYVIRADGGTLGYVSISARAAEQYWFEIAAVRSVGLSARPFWAAYLAIELFRERHPAVMRLYTWIHECNHESKTAAHKMGWRFESCSEVWEKHVLSVREFLCCFSKGDSHDYHSA